MNEPINNFLDLVYPHEKIGVAVDPCGMKNDVARIKETDFQLADELALEEARRFEAYQDDRIRASESKATMVLAFQGVLLPILVAQIDKLKELLLDALPNGLLLAVGLIGGIYFVSSIIWAFRTFRVSRFHTIDVIDLVKKWETLESEHSIRADLTKHVMSNVRKNYDVTNDKVTCLLHSYRHLFRAFIVLLLSVLVNFLWEPIIELAQMAIYLTNTL